MFVVREIMSALETDIQWFIARDGRQHGPLSDVEMHKLVELGHLRQTDLVWRLGFPDWRPVAAVFPPGSRAAAAPAAVPFATAAEAAGRWQPSTESTGGATQQDRSVGRPASMYGGAASAPAAAQATAIVQEPKVAARQAPAREPVRQAGKWRRALLVATGLLAIVGAGAWFGYKNRTQLSALTAAAVKEDASAQATPATFETAAVNRDEGTAALDVAFQKRPAWVAIKQEFPEWYEVRLKEAAQLGKEGKPGLEVTRHLVESIVGLRRQHANQALAASTARHKELAAAFLENLKSLAQSGADSCYDFISKGETSPDVVALMQNADKSARIEAQVVAIVAAIAEGRKSPVTHSAPIKSDYDVLAAELNRLGWTQADMQLFADSKALARAPRERVCKMVQDWFAAHLAITDAATQERLLFETLRPVVAG
jgi:hypothetical protein